MKLDHVIKILAGNELKNKEREFIEFVVDTLDELLEYTNECNPLEGFNYKGFVYQEKYSYGEEGIYKNYKYRPNIPDNLTEKIEDFDEYIYSLIDSFREELNEELKDRFKVELTIVGRSGGYWGLSIDDANKLIDVNSKFIKRIEKKLRNRNYLKKFCEEVYDVDKEDYEDFILMDNYVGDDYKIAEYFCEKYKDDIIDYSELQECLDYIDKRVDEEEKFIIEDIKERIKGEE